LRWATVMKPVPMMPTLITERVFFERPGCATLKFGIRAAG